MLENEHDGIGPSNFIAVQTILCRCPFTQMKLNLQGFYEMVLTTCPHAQLFKTFIIVIKFIITHCMYTFYVQMTLYAVHYNEIQVLIAQ